MSILDMISYIKNSPVSKILDASENILDSFEKTPSLSMQMNLIETPKKTNDTNINNNEIDHSDFF